MNKIVLGTIVGAILGLLDGSSAFFIPEAAGMMTEIIIGSTVKGLITGIIVGLVAQRVSSILMVGLYGAIAGLLLSTLAAIPSGTYMEIIVPGVLVGFIAGLITAKWGK
ncbi:MAG: hypothetical protein JXR82_13470 [Marinifilaceae bacterium]|nr:hypothetical protein [Marinifilaceae bacterium]